MKSPLEAVAFCGVARPMAERAAGRAWWRVAIRDADVGKFRTWTQNACASYTASASKRMVKESHTTA